MKGIPSSLCLLLLLVGCGGQEQPATSPEQVEKMRQQYIEQAKAFSAEPTPGQKK
jgi:hypothetical protein